MRGQWFPYTTLRGQGQPKVISPNLTDNRAFLCESMDEWGIGLCHYGNVWKPYYIRFLWRRFSLFSPKNLTLIENNVFEVSYSFVYFYVLSQSTFIEAGL